MTLRRIAKEKDMSIRNTSPIRASVYAWYCFALFALVAAMPAFSQVDVRITADNAYRFGFGPINGPFTPATPNAVEAFLAGDIFNCSTGPEVYVVPSPNPSDYLYIV